MPPAWVGGGGEEDRTLRGWHGDEEAGDDAFQIAGDHHDAFRPPCGAAGGLNDVGAFRVMRQFGECRGGALRPFGQRGVLAGFVYADEFLDVMG